MHFKLIVITLIGSMRALLHQFFIAFDHMKYIDR